MSMCKVTWPFPVDHHSGTYVRGSTPAGGNVDEAGGEPALCLISFMDPSLHTGNTGRLNTLIMC